MNTLNSEHITTGHYRHMFTFFHLMVSKVLWIWIWWVKSCDAGQWYKCRAGLSKQLQIRQYLSLQINSSQETCSYCERSISLTKQTLSDSGSRSEKNGRRACLFHFSCSQQLFNLFNLMFFRFDAATPHAERAGTSCYRDKWTFIFHSAFL